MAAQRGRGRPSGARESEPFSKIHLDITSTIEEHYLYIIRMKIMIIIIIFLGYDFSSYLLSSPLFFSLPLINSRNSDPGSHSRLSPPPPHYGSCFAFLSRQDFSSFFPRRLGSNCSPKLLYCCRRSQQYILSLFFAK